MRERTNDTNGPSNRKIAVFGLFDSRQQLESAVKTLLAEGFHDEDLSALLPNQRLGKKFAHDKHSKAPEGALVGATAGSTFGGTLGLLAGLGALAIPGLGPFIAAGPIIAALAGAGVGGAIGTLTGALAGMGIPEYEAKRYESFLSGGGTLLTVHAEDNAWAKRAKAILMRIGAQSIDNMTEVSSVKPLQPSHV